MTLPEFVQFLRSGVASNPMFSPSLGESTLSQLELLSRFTDRAAIEKQMTGQELSSLLGMDEAMTGQIFRLYYGDADAGESGEAKP